jgi:hypothetical protein
LGEMEIEESEWVQQDESHLLGEVHSDEDLHSDEEAEEQVGEQIDWEREEPVLRGPHQIEVIQRRLQEQRLQERPLAIHCLDLLHDECVDCGSVNCVGSGSVGNEKGAWSTVPLSKKTAHGR